MKAACTRYTFKLYFNCNLMVQWKIESDQALDYPDVKAELDPSLCVYLQEEKIVLFRNR